MSTAGSPSPVRVLVLGAGFGGLELSSRVAEACGDAVAITLVDRAPGFVFGFSKLDVMFGRSTPDAVLLPSRFEGVPRILAKHDGMPERKSAAEINPDRSEYSGCRVILLVRDLRDTVVSNYFQVTRRERSYVGDLASFVHWPRGSFEAMLRYYNVWAAQRRVPRDFLLIRYEDLHADTAREMRRVAAFLGLGQVADAGPG